MKKRINKLIIIACLMLLPILTVQLSAQPQPPAIGHGAATTNQPAGAPIDGGLSILLVLGAAFGTKKVYSLKKKVAKEE